MGEKTNLRDLGRCLLELQDQRKRRLEQKAVLERWRRVLYILVKIKRQLEGRWTAATENEGAEKNQKRELLRNVGSMKNCAS